MVAYKVVTKDRKSSNAPFLEPKSRWVLDYKKGETVKAIKGSVGILAFGNLEAAISFKGGHPHSRRLMIVKVEGENPTRGVFIAGQIKEDNLERFHHIKRVASTAAFDDLWAAPLGTIAFKSVKVLT